jgi:Tol biopolymer transport system component
LLRYLTDHFLSNPEANISEYQLGFEVFERPPGFDPQIDSVVRVQTARLRQKLGRYYAGAGKADGVFIEIPRGGYSLSVSFRGSADPPPLSTSSAAAIPPQNGDRSSRRTHVFPLRALWLAGTLLVLIAAAAAFFRRGSSQNTKPTEPTIISFTSDPGLEDDASFSPDGTAVAFSQSSDAGGKRNIVIKQIESRELRQITHDDSLDVNPAWSPDGSAIAFYRVKKNGGEFVIVPLAGGVARVVAHSRSIIAGTTSTFSPMPAVGPAWTKDGHHLVIADKNGASKADCLFLLDLNDGSRKLLTSPPLTADGDGSPAVSPDGKTIAFIRRATSYNLGDLFMVSLEGGQPRRITFDKADMNGVAWITNGQLIFSSNRGGAHRLWKLSIATGQTELFPAAGLNALHPAVDPTRNRLIYTEWKTNTNIWRVDLRQPPEKRRPVAWITSTLHQHSPQYSPDGKHLVFVSDRSGYLELWLADAPDWGLRRLTHFDGSAVGSPQWSPDGQEIAFDLRAKGISNVFVINMNTGASRQITQESSDTMAPNWSTDSRSLYVVSRRTDQLEIWRVPLDGTPWTQLTQNGGFQEKELPVASQLLFTLPVSPGFWMLNLRSGQESVIPELASVKSYRYWTISSSGLYYVSGGDTPSPVNFYDFKTRRITPVSKIEGALFSGTPSLTISSDGQYLAYAQVDGFNADLMLAENW